LAIPKKGIDLNLLRDDDPRTTGDGGSTFILESAWEEPARDEVRLLVEWKESIEVSAFFTFFALLILAVTKTKTKTKKELVEQVRVRK
jgi:hypothetical protein